MDTTTQEVEEIQTEVAPTEQVVETTTASTEATTEIVDTPIETPVAPQQIVSFEDGLKDFGFTKEELAELKAKREAEKAEAEKPIKEQSEWAEKVQFGITNKLITKEDLDTHTIISKKDDIALVFENFEFENEDDLEGSELEQAKLEAFNEIYNQSSTNEKAKAKGLEALRIEANNLRNSVNEKINKVNSDYTEHKISQNFFNDRQAVLNELNEKGFKEIIEVEGVKLEVNIPVQTTEKEVREMLTSDEGATVLKFMRDVYKNNQEGAKQVFRELIINKNKSQAIAKTAYEAGLEAGKALNAGATAPFVRENVQHQPKPSTDKEQQMAKRRAAGLPEEC
jgi:hypothetical protein